MISEFVQLVLSVLVLVLGAGFEEILPRFAGVGFPILLIAVQFLASRRGRMAAVMFAIAAGALEDALSSLSPMTSVSYFLIVAFLARWSGLPRLATALTYPCYQVWLAVWTIGMGGSVYTRILVAFPIGLATAFVVGAALLWLERKAVVDAQG